MTYFLLVHLVAVLVACAYSLTVRARLVGAIRPRGRRLADPSPRPTAPTIDLTRADRARERRARLRAELFVSRSAR